MGRGGKDNGEFGYKATLKIASPPVYLFHDAQGQRGHRTALWEMQGTLP